MSASHNIGIRIIGCKPADWDIVNHELNENNMVRIDLKVRVSPLLARAAVYVALKNDDNCAILYDKLSTCTDFCVGACGHVFSDQAQDLEKCPVCMSLVYWTHVKRSDVDM